MDRTSISEKKDIKYSALWALLSFLVPAAVLAAILAVCGIAPFGSGTLISESGEKWFESFTGMYESVVSGNGVFYRLNAGFGSSSYTEFSTGLCSPFLFLALFFGQRSLAAAYSVITVIRTGAAGAAAWYMLGKCTDNSKRMCFALSCGYSLCGFTAFSAYYPSVADGAVFFPLLVAGIYGYVREARPVKLFVFGTLFFLTCSRLTFVGLIMSAALYAVFFFQRGSRKHWVYKTALFLSTLLCSAATNVLLTVPVWNGSIYYKNGVFSDIPMNDILSDICFGGYGTNPNAGVGLCLAGLLMIGFFSYFFNTGVKIGEKLSAAFAALLLLSIHSVPVLAKYLLGFGNSGNEAVNAGFMLALLALICTARTVSLRRRLPVWGVVCSVAAYAVLAAAVIFLRKGDLFALIAEAGLGVFACAVFVQLRNGEESSSAWISGVTAAVLALFGAVHCAGATGKIHSPVTAERLAYVAESRTEAEKELERSYISKNEEVPRFYRTRSTDGVSDSVNINRNEVEGLTVFLERLGIMRGSEYGGADNFTEFTDILFGIANPDYGYYAGEELSGEVCSPAYLIGDWSNGIPDDLNAFEVQDYLALEWFGTSVFEKAEPAETSTELSSESSRYKWTFGNETTAVNKYIIEVDDGCNLYMLADGDYSFAVGDDSRSSWRKGCAGGIYDLSGLYKADESGEEGRVTVYLSADVSQGVPEPVFAFCRGNIASCVKPSCAEYISYRGSTIRFMFDIDKAQTAITSIPFESGWEITVNGKSARPVELCGGLIGIRLEKGKNSIVMNYMPPYFRVSFWFSLVMLAMGLYFTLKIEHQAARRRKVRMAFRAVEMKLSRMAADDPDEEDGKDNSETDGAANQADPVREEKERSEENESEENCNEEV